MNSYYDLIEQYNNKYANQLYEIFSKEVNVELYTSENNIQVKDFSEKIIRKKIQWIIIG